MQPATVIQKTAFRDLYDRNIKYAWMQGWGEPEHEFEKIYSTINTQMEDERSAYITSFGHWQQKTGRLIPYDQLYDGYGVIITPYEYWMAFSIDQATWEDDQAMHALFGARAAASHAQMGRETLVVIAAAPFNLAANTSALTFSPWQTPKDSTVNGTTISATSTCDGVALLSTAHPIVTGGTYANTPSSTTALSLAALQAGIISMNKCLNARGNLERFEPRTLVYPTDSKFLAGELLQSPQLPYTATSTPNLAPNGITGVEWTRLTNTTAWFLLAAPSADMYTHGHLLKYVQRIGPQFDRDNPFDTGDRRFKGRYRVGFGAFDWRGCYGSSST